MQVFEAKKSEPSVQLTQNSSIKNYPFKVYHIVKPKGNRTMIELKITVDKAVKLEQEVKDLYQSIVGAPVKEAPIAVELVKKETPKAEAPKEEPEPKEEPAPKEEPVEEAPKQAAPSLEETREAVKDVIAKAADKTQAKTEFKAFLDSIGADKVTSATDEQRIKIMEWGRNRV